MAIPMEHIESSAMQRPFLVFICRLLVTNFERNILDREKAAKFTQAASMVSTVGGDVVPAAGGVLTQSAGKL